MTRYGTNINLTNGIPRETFDITEEQFRTGISQQEADKIESHFESTCAQIVTNEELFNQKMMEDGADIAYNFENRREVFRKARDDQAQKEMNEL